MRLPWSTRRTRKVPPYEKLAIIYDHIMRHVDYRRWAEYAHDLIQRWHPRTETVLDVACGTGNLLLEFRRFPPRLYGCDSSFAMVIQARQKPQLKRVPIWRANMTELSLKQPMDVILCLYDSINYIMNKEGIIQFFQAAAQSLKQRGLLIFDICTERNSIEFFYNYYDHEKEDTFSYDRWSHYDPKMKIQFTEFKLHFRSDPQTYLEVHQQRIYSQPTIRALIRCSPFELLRDYNEFTFYAPHTGSNRVHYVLRRKD